MFPYAFDHTEIKKELDKNGLKQVLFNLPTGDWDGGDRGLAADPMRKQEFLLGIAKAIEIAKVLGVQRLNCLVGKVSGPCDADTVKANLLENICYAADELKKAGLDLMIEPVNHLDMPGFYLNTTDQAMEFIQAADRDNIYLQYDIYHAEREGEDHEQVLQKYFPKIGHVHIADNPGRNEPGTGTIPLKKLMDKLDEMGYQGYVGSEYKPTTEKTADSLGWVREYGYQF
jgi:hydroxypyruvate isomerase